ncbi:MAG TPA: 6-phosphogluconolactonase [Cyclobacteriaceae bacterium]|jgi:6-phosphogluconolactonase
MVDSEFHILPDSTSLIESAADFLRNAINQVVSTKPFCSVALSGGTTPKGLYKLLASPPFVTGIPWTKLRFFLGDERYVPHDHPDSNYKMIRESLFSDREPEAGTLFPVDTSLPSHKAAAEYERTLRKQIGDDGSFDIILLGLGDDAHTASLFPNTTALEEKTAWVTDVYVEKLKSRRITFTFPLINAARIITFLVSGSAKAAAVRNVIRGPRAPHNYPAQCVEPRNGVVHWFVDKDAASELK